jgi:Tfp pilus assembly protein PilF
VGLAEATIHLRILGLREPSEVRDAARTAASDAVKLDPELPEAHATLATIACWTGMGRQGRRGFLRALEISESSAAATTGYVSLLTMRVGQSRPWSGCGGAAR